MYHINANESAKDIKGNSCIAEMFFDLFSELDKEAQFGDPLGLRMAM